MEISLRLIEHGPRLWTQELGYEIRQRLREMLEGLDVGGVLVIDADGVEVFDYSFAAELFGRTVVSLPGEYPGRFVVVEHLTRYARQNLEKALVSLNLAIIERVDGRPRLLGKVHPSDEETFDAIVQAPGPVAAAELRDRLGATLNAVNERLSKLIGMGFVRREKGRSPAGREQFLYRVLA